MHGNYGNEITIRTVNVQFYGCQSFRTCPIIGTPSRHCPVPHRANVQERLKFQTLKPFVARFSRLFTPDHRNLKPELSHANPLAAVASRSYGHSISCSSACLVSFVIGRVIVLCSCPLSSTFASHCLVLRFSSSGFAADSDNTGYTLVIFGHGFEVRKALS